MGKILLTGLRTDLAAPLAAALELQGHAVRFERWEDVVLDIVGSTPFCAIVSAYPLSGAGFGILLSATRSRVSASRNAGLILLVPPAKLDLARQLIGRGVNRVVRDDEPLETILEAIRELMEVAPRVPVVAPAWISLDFGGESARVLCQTENVSTTGMLVRGCTNCRPGMRVAFQLQLDDREEPVAGTAQVARTADPQREGLRGFGARFLDLSEGDRIRLQDWLTQNT